MKVIDPIITMLVKSPWAILPEVLIEIVAKAKAFVASPPAFIDPVAAERNAQPNAAMRKQGLIAGVAIHGPIVYRGNWVADLFGFTSVERIQGAFRAALADPDVKAIVLDVDSPGGTVYGIDELAKEIAAGRKVKPIVAIANPLMASAAYWIGAAASEIVSIPSGMTGSIGVYVAHEDWSKHLEDFGIDVTLISAGKYKTEGSPFAPLSDEARAFYQAQVDDIYSTFVGAVAKYRNATPGTVKNGYGEGRVLLADAAVSAGMIDRVATFEATLKSVGAAPRVTGRKALSELREKFEEAISR